MLNRNDDLSRYLLLSAVLATWLAVFFTPLDPARATALGDLAASMQPGTWATLSASGDSVLRVGGSTGTIMPYAMSAVWNPFANEVWFCGNDHGTTNKRCVKYSESTNAWTLVADYPNTVLNGTHGYEHLAINTFNGNLYHRDYGCLCGTASFDVYSGGSWTANYLINENTYQQVAEAIGFWSGHMTGFTDGVGALIHYDSGEPNGVVSFIDPTNMTLSYQTSGFGGTSTYHSFFEYSSVKNVAVFGGGDLNPNKIWRLNSDRTVTQLTDSPVSVGIQKGFVAADPVSGNFIILNGGNLYELNPNGSGTYTLLTGSRVPPSSVGNPVGGASQMFVVPISTYGVILYATCTSSACSFGLYKHAVGSGVIVTPLPSDTIAPSVPSNVSAVAASSSQISISWNASTDNIGVQGYKIYRSGAQVGIATTTAYSDSNLSPSKSYTYTVAAYDAAGNTSAQSAPASATTQASTSASSGGSDFQTRCSQPGVVKCVGFDSQSEITGNWGIDPQGVVPDTGGSPTIDTNVKASGNGSIKFVIPSNHNGSVGDFYANFSNDLSVQFGENSEFYAQWRMRIDDNFYAATQGRAGMKHAIIGTGSRPGAPASSCTDLELVVQNNSARGFPQMYHSCGGGPINYEPIFDDRYGAYDFKLQNARPSPYCLYSQGYTTPKTYFPPDGNCFAYFPNEWMTFQMHVKLGPLQQIGTYWYFMNSTVELWVGREGQPSELVISAPGRNLEVNTDPLQKYGQIWLLPYSGSDTYPQGGTVWYDELIISTSKLNDPNGVASATQPPTAPTGLTLK